MALIVETGSGADPLANSYVSVADALAYHAARLHRASWATADTTTQEQALITATQFIDTYIRFHGSRASQDQPLEWPRINVTDRDGRLLPATEIPQRLKDAVCEQAFAALTTDLSQQDSKAGMTRLKADSVEIEWDATRKPTRQKIPSLVANLLSPLGRVATGYCRTVGRS